MITISELPQAWLDILRPEQPPADTSTAEKRSAAQSRGDHIAAYVRAAVDDEIAQLRTAREGNRNNALNHAAFSLGTLIGAGALNRSDAEAELQNAALAIGLSGREAGKTIASGLTAGIANPRDLSHVTAQRRSGRGPAKDTGNDQSGMAESVRIMGTLTALGYSFAYNEVTERTEVKGQPLTDEGAAVIRVQMRDAGELKTRAIEDVYTAYAYEHAYHPIKDFIASLSWDGQDHIRELTNHFHDRHAPFANGDTWAYRSMRRWLVGVIARIRRQAQLSMLVLEGPQSLGKSFLVRWLGSPLFEYVTEGPIDPESRDCLGRLVSKWLWEVTELGATTRRADVEGLKAFITLRFVTVRGPYRRYDRTSPALAALVGTVNDAGGFLNDTTGTRRFLTLSLESIDWRYSESIDVRQVWAQAAALFDSGMSPQLDADERTRQAEINADFEVIDPVHETIGALYAVDPDAAKVRAYSVTAAEIIRAVQIEIGGTSKASAKAIAEHLKRAGAVADRSYINGQRARVWWGVRSLKPAKEGDGTGQDTG